MSIGYLIGGRSSLKPVDRVLLGAIIGFIAGIAVTAILGPFVPIDDTVMLISLISSVAGALFGESMSWAPTPPKAPKRHVYFDFDDDDEFDREIEESLRGSS